jgi:signal transduction histidine kinase
MVQFLIFVPSQFGGDHRRAATIDSKRERRLRAWHVAMLTSAEVASTMRRALASPGSDAASTESRSRRRILVSAESLTGRGARRPKPAETLLAVSRVVGSNLALADVLRETTRELARAVHADIGSVWRLEPSERALSPVAGYRVPKAARVRMSSPLAFANLLTATQRKTGVPSYSQDSAGKRRFDHPFLNLVPHRSVLIQPFRVRGQLAGVFVLAWTRARHTFSDVELRLVDAIAQQAGIAVENAELMAASQRFTEELEQRVADRTAQLKLALDGLRESREELRALSLHIEGVRELERTRISREIHDELGQALTALKMDLAALRTREGPPADAAATARAAGMVDGMLASVRRIAAELRPLILDDLGLQPALEWQAQEFATRSGIKCRFRCTGAAADIDAERSTALFRMSQELLTNVARHSGATHVTIQLVVGRTSVRLEVRDNGRGMRSAPSQRPGLGLLGMRERAAGFNGDVLIDSGPHKGTHVRIRIPLARGTQSRPGSGGDSHGHHRVRRPSRRPPGAGADHPRQLQRRAG